MSKLLLPGGSGRGMARGGGFVASGIQNIRAPIARRSGGQYIQFSSGTTLDADDPAADNSGDSGWGAMNTYDTGGGIPAGYNDKWIALFGAFQLRTAGALVCDPLFAERFTTNINIRNAHNDAVAAGHLLLFGVTSFGGLTAATLNWNNRATPTLVALNTVPLSASIETYAFVTGDYDMEAITKESAIQISGTPGSYAGLIIKAVCDGGEGDYANFTFGVSNGYCYYLGN